MGKPLWVGIMIMAGLMSICPSIVRGELRDPFVSIIDMEKQKVAEQKIVDLSNVTIKGILWSDRKVIAIIDDKLVMNGDTWRDFVIEKIDKDSLTLRYEDKTYTLPIDRVAAPQKEDQVSKTKSLSLPDEEAPWGGMMPYEGEKE